MNTQPQNLSTPELASNVLNDVTLLLKTEGELARTEMKRNMQQAVAGIVSLVIAAAILIAGLTIVLFALGTGFVEWFTMTPWIAYLIAGGIGLAIGAVLVKSAKAALSATSLAPTRTAENLKKDARVAKESVT